MSVSLSVDEPELAVHCRGLTKRYADTLAVAGIDLSIVRGECFGLLGPNGAGKTTTVEILEGLTAADSGHIAVLGQAWGEGDDRALKERIGVQLQENQLGDKLTVLEVLILFRSLYRNGREPEEMLQLFELESKKDARYVKLSGGQKQRVTLACALISEPELLFLDEPTTGLDPQARLQVWNVVRDFRDAGGTVVITTHYMEEAAQLCDRLAIMDHGKIVAVGSPAELIAGLNAKHVVEFEASEELRVDAIEALLDPGQLSRRGQGYVVHSPSVLEVLPKLLAEFDRQGVSLSRLTTHEPTLDDVFLDLTGKALRDG